jgi:hypothetical protein
MRSGAFFVRNMMNNDNDNSTAYGQTFQLRLPGNRLRCQCGHRVHAGDFDVFEGERMVRAVCPRCFELLLELETRW